MCSEKKNESNFVSPCGAVGQIVRGVPICFFFFFRYNYREDSHHSRAVYVLHISVTVRYFLNTQKKKRIHTVHHVSIRPLRGNRFLQVCVHVCTKRGTHIHTYAHTRTYIRIYSHTHTYIHTYIHTHTYTYRYIYIPIDRRGK